MYNIVVTIWGNMKMKKSLILLLFIFSVAGCSRHLVGVNGFSATGTNLQIPQFASIQIVTDPNVPNPILEKEIAVKIEKLLNIKDYAVTTANPNYYLVFRYGMESGRVISTRPVYYPADYSTIYGYGHRRSHFSTIYSPGYSTYAPYSETVFTRWLVLKLIDAKNYQASDRPQPLWIGEITSTGQSSDLRNIITYMLVAAFDHFGENTHKRLSITITPDDPTVMALYDN